MATHEGVRTVTLIAGAALTNGQPVEVTGVRTVSPTSAVTDVVVGIAAETVASGGDVPIALLEGVLEVIAGGVITPGQVCIPTAAGAVIGVTGLAGVPVDQMGIGIALTGAASGEIFSMLAQPVAAANA